MNFHQRINGAFSILILLLVLALGGCQAGRQDSATRYPKKPAETQERKAGAAMFFYEQAEKDMDVNDSVIVTPPDEAED